jgi:hypothetical protein
MAVQFHRADLLLVVYRADAHRPALDQSPVAPVQSKAAMVLFRRFGRTVCIAQVRSLHESNAGLHPGQPDRERCNQRYRCPRIALLVIGLRQPQNVARILDERILEPGGCAEKWKVAGPREADSRNRAVGASIRHPGNAPEAMKLRQ